MVVPRRKNLAASKRRKDEEGEDEEGSILAGVEDGSMSEASVISDADDADAEGSETSEVEIPQISDQPTISAVNGQTVSLPDSHQPVNAGGGKSSFAAITNDTAAMLNGLQLVDNMDEAEEIHYDDLAGGLQAQAVTSAPVPAPVRSVISPATNAVDKRRQEHEEYKKRRDTDPSFVPNRGGFFMHDSRSVAIGRNGFRPFGRGRGRGRAAFGGPQSTNRALRPNQQGFGRTRARASFSISYGPLSSRRTSAYAGSAHSPSVAPSRRSSLAREMATEGVISPSSVSLSRPSNVTAEPGKPVVRLPPAAQQEIGTEISQSIPVVNLPQVPMYPLPEKPTYRENRPVPIPMHQPKPQKTVSVTDIESPATFAFHPPQPQDQQPFHQQVPTQVMSQTYPQDPSMYPHSRHPSHPSQASGGTPLSQIPERAAQAPPFQPYAYHQPPPFYSAPFPPTLYYYPSTEQLHAAGPSVMAPAFIPGQPYPFTVPVAPAPLTTEATAQSGTVAHESNGMVYYYDSSQLNAGGDGNNAYAGADYTVPPSGGVVGIGGMMTPPIQFYPQPSPAVFYPPQ
ncbi:MAG: hypothetical protein Q9182_002399 [Xanthomendoza sp. 2 TL-2023]